MKKTFRVGRLLTLVQSGGWRGRALELLLVGAGFTLFYAIYFSPVWFRGGFLAPGDAATEYLPLYYRHWHLWTDLLLAGYPEIADLQFQINYLPKLLIPTYNAFIISSYVLMALGTYAFVSAYTKSRYGALAAAIIVSGSGFMVAHLGHATIIHAACWLPWIVWSFHRISVGRSALATAVGSLAVGLSLLGGHPQVSIIVFLVAGSFWLLLLGEAIRLRCWRPIAVGGATIFGTGLLLSAITIMPFVEFTLQGVRAAWTLADFDSFSETSRTLLLVIFPNLFGTHQQTPFGPYFGPWNLTELALYAGSGALVLAFMGFWLSPRRSHAWFWLAVAVGGLLLSMGASTPLGQVVFHLPVLGAFRAQARFGLAYIFSTAILVGMLFASVEARLPGEKLRRPGGWGVFALCAGVGAAVIVGLKVSSGSAATVHVADLRVALAVGLPCLFALSTPVAWLIWRKRRHWIFASVVFGLLAADLASFGMFYEWRFNFVPKKLTQLSAGSEALLKPVRASGSRVLPTSADSMPFGPFKPDSNIFWGVPVSTSYGPLLPSRVQTYAAVDTSGNPHFDITGSPLLDVFGVGWIAAPSRAGLPTSLSLSRQCGLDIAARTEGEYEIPSGTSAKSIRVESQLSCSTSVPDAGHVADIVLSTQAGTGSIAVLAGSDTAEWAYDNLDPRLVAHKRAPIASTYDYGGRRAHTYVFEKPLSNDGLVTLSGLKVRLAWPGTLGLNVKRIELLGEGGEVVASILPKVGDSSWTPIETRGILSKRAAPAPGAWGVCDLRTLRPAEVKLALQRGELPSGEPFRAHATALFDGESPSPKINCKVPPTVEAFNRREGKLSMKVSAAEEGLLVVSNTFYPGWQATVDGQSVLVHPVDGFIQAIVIPAGFHEVDLRYRPLSFILGAVLTFLGFVSLLVPPIWRRYRQKSIARVYQ